MKKHLLSLLLTAVFVIQANATAVTVTDSIFRQTPYTHRYVEVLATPIQPSYLRDAVVPSWADNWFVSISGGASAFLGSPLGCDDLWGRIKPSFSLSVGKWHTSVVGNRLSFQGFEWIGGALTAQRYRHYHADLLVNLTPAMGLGSTDCRFDIIPLVGLGLIDNRTTHRHPFAVNYGLQGRYRISNRLHISAELGNAMTFADADGIGSAHRLGDNLLSFSAGITCTFGKHVGWKKIVDAQPYIIQSERLAAYLHDGSIKRLRDDDNDRTLRDKRIPVNDYSGLNSLRQRLRESGDINNRNGQRGLSPSDSTSTDGYNADFGNASNGDVGNKFTYNSSETSCLGAPIYIFFQLGTTDLVDSSQIVNLHEIARKAIKEGLRIEVVGAADAATGNEEINDALGADRAKLIASYLKNEGVASDRIAIFSVGGISKYIPSEANRNAIVRLFLP